MNHPGTMKSRPTMCKVREVKSEARDISTVKMPIPTFLSRNVHPGQFMMVWIPGIDEIPMSISNLVGEDEIWITVKRVGEATSALHTITTGEILGLRGPYGTSYSVEKTTALVAAGGIGVAPLFFLSKKLLETNSRVTVILGARSADRIAFGNEFEKLIKKSRGSTLVVVTNDGSSGIKGYVSEVADKLMDEKKFTKVYTCGPEPMMKKIISKAMTNGLQIEASLERYMRCGIGICGSCHIGRYLVCRDGPIFSREKLDEISEYLKSQ